jgi:hypothetical protein
MLCSAMLCKAVLGCWCSHSAISDAVAVCIYTIVIATIAVVTAAAAIAVCYA